MDESDPLKLVFTPDRIVDLLVDSFQSHGRPTPDTVEKKIDEFLQGPFASLRPSRDEIAQKVFDRVTVKMAPATVMEDSTDHDPWIDKVNDADWRLWNRLRNYLREVKKFHPRVLAELDTSTSLALGRLDSPERTGAFSRRGLVVGHVQSGKTTHYTALAAKALDAGYRAVIIFAGMHNNLRAQTQVRIDSDLIGRESRTSMLGGSRSQRTIGVAARARDRGDAEQPDFQILTVTTAADDGDFNQKTAGDVLFNLDNSTRLVMVVKKNGHVLRRLQKWLENFSEQDGGDVRAPTLFIDDEADQASVNTGKSEDAPTAINARIRELLKRFRRNGYVGYTATPFANVFIDATDDDDEHGKDLFPESFIVNLKAPSSYIGPDKVFGNQGDEAAGISEREPLPMQIDVDDADAWLPPKHKKHQVPGKMPASLEEALKLFVLTCAARAARGDETSHASMLIHATRFTDVQDRIRGQMDDEISDLRALTLHADAATRSRLERTLRDLWHREIVAKAHAFQKVEDLHVGPLPAWDEIVAKLPLALRKIELLTINGQSGEALAYDTRREQGMWVIAIGGDKLSRGLTLEGLTVSYFLRASAAYDTLMQMGRWFGYRPGYADLCRIYTPPDLAYAFREITLAAEELRRDFDRMVEEGLKPVDFGLRVRTPSDGLLITAANKLRGGSKVSVRFADDLVQALEFPEKGPLAEENRKALRGFLGALPAPVRTQNPSDTWYHWAGVEAEDVLAFLRGYRARHTPSFMNRCERLRQYIEQRVDDGELTTWSVVMASTKLANNGTADIAGLKVGLSKRRRTPQLSDGWYRAPAVASGVDEWADFTSEERKEKISGTFSAAGRVSARKARPAHRGLLLLYPLVHPDAQVEGVVDDWMLSTAISFPDSSRARPLEYTANGTWMQRNRFFNYLDDGEFDNG